MADIYLLIEGKQEGPYTEDQVRQSLTEGLIPPDLPAWHEGLPADWVPISSIMETSQQPPPPVPTLPTQTATVVYPPSSPSPIPNIEALSVIAPPPFVPERTFDDKPQNTKLATTALVLSGLGLTICLFFFAIPGVILGHVVLAGKPSGKIRNRAILSLALGYPALAFAFILIIIGAVTLSDVSNVGHGGSDSADSPSVPQTVDFYVILFPDKSEMDNFQDKVTSILSTAPIDDPRELWGIVTRSMNDALEQFEVDGRVTRIPPGTSFYVLETYQDVNSPRDSEKECAKVKVVGGQYQGTVGYCYYSNDPDDHFLKWGTFIIGP